MITSVEIDMLAVALSEAQANILPAPKDKTNPHFKNRYSDLTSIWEACRGALSKCNLAVVQSPSMTPERNVRITTRILHKSGQWIQGELDLKPAQDTPQAIGSAITYGKRYALAAMLGVVSDEDDDGHAASHNTKQLQAQQQSQMKTYQDEIAKLQAKLRADSFFDKNNFNHTSRLETLLARKNMPADMHQMIYDKMQGRQMLETILDAAIKELVDGART